jgi:hypothetical protein
MARVWYGGIITDMKGSIGGTTFQANAAAKISKMRSTRRKGNSPLQLECMTIFQDQLTNWAALSQYSKELWNDFALAHSKTNKWGETKIMTGINWFLSINNYLSLCGETPLAEPPVWETPLAIPEYDGQFIPEDTFLNFLDTFVHTNHYILVFTSPLLKTVSTANRKVLRLTKYVDPGSTDEIYFENDWVSTHNIPVPIPGDPVQKNIFVALITVHKTKGIASAFNSIYVVYEPT